ncbi:hypothetical protein Tco_0190578 [Tanacetum coccineum]
MVNLSTKRGLVSKNYFKKIPHYGIDLWLQFQIFYDHFSYPVKREINHTAGGKLRDKSAEESCAIIKDHALYDNKIWNDPSDLVSKPVKAISLPTNASCTLERRLIELEDQVNYLLKAPKTPTPTKRSSPQLSRAYANVVSSNQHTSSSSEPPKEILSSDT